MTHRILAVTFALAVTSSAAQALPVTWQLSGWSFDDGGLASGSFIFDADTSTFSAIAVSTGGGAVPANIFNRDDPFSSSTADGLSFAGPDGLIGFDSFLAILAAPLTNAGGIVLTSNFSIFDIDTLMIASNFGAGRLIGAPAAVVPLPAALPLLLASLGAILGLRRHRRALH